MKPNIIMLGSTRCGTTSLHNWLSQHGDIFGTTPKEPRFFEYEYPMGESFYDGKYLQGYNNEQYILESSVLNMTALFVPERIKKYCDSETRLIMCVRNPADRFYSDYCHWSRMRPGRLPISFRKFVEKSIGEFDPEYYDSEEKFCSNRDIKGGQYHLRLLEYGMYDYFFNHWRSITDLELNVVIFDYMIENPISITSELFKIFELDDRKIIANAYNQTSKINKFAWRDNHRDSYKMLKAFYRSSVEDFSKTLSVDLTDIWGYK